MPKHLKKKSLAFMLTLYTVLNTVYADECSQIEHQLADSEKTTDYAKQLQLIDYANENYCFEGDVADGKKVATLNRWALAIFDKVVLTNQGEIAEFDPNRQLPRLKQYTAEIAAMNEEVTLTTDNWLPSLLDFLLVYRPDNPKATNTSLLIQLDDVALGYIESLKENQIPKTIEKAQLRKFISNLLEHLELSEPDGTRYAALRGPTDSIDTSSGAIQMAFRSLGLGSSNNSSATSVRPIRFEYNSTELSERGESEYKKLLPVFRQNTTKSIFLIGHADPPGSVEHNCWLSMCRVQSLKQRLLNEDNIHATISVSWAGENIPLDSGQASAYLSRQATEPKGENEADEARRRVEIEINGTSQKAKYKGLLCPVNITKPCESSPQ